jgi:acetylornithine deacetylase/succinyl-diaminopimelate desuccinylase-like protein
MSDPLNYALQNRRRFVGELKDFIRFPTVSAQPQHTKDLKECAKWLADHLHRIGLQNARVIPMAGHPMNARLFGPHLRSMASPVGIRDQEVRL